MGAGRQDWLPALLTLVPASDTFPHPPLLPGAYLVPYLVLLIIIGIPLFFLELAVGQRIRRGSIGVWHYVCPRLGGIGFSSCIVSRGWPQALPGRQRGCSWVQGLQQESWARARTGKEPLSVGIAPSWSRDRYFRDWKLLPLPEAGYKLGNVMKEERPGHVTGGVGTSLLQFRHMEATPYSALLTSP